MSKYHSKKIVVDGLTFDSKKEWRRFCELSLLEGAGEIADLQRQVKFVLIPAQYEESGEAYKRGIHKGEKKRGKLLERECAYFADFTYTKNGEKVVEDVKGYKGGGAYEVFKIKRKLMLERYGIRVQEV